MTKDAEQLQDVIWTAINSKYKDSTNLPTIEQIEDEADLLRNSLSLAYTVSELEFSQIKEYLFTNINHRIGVSVTLRGEDGTHYSWYKTYNGSTYYWDRYKKYLSNICHWGPNEIKSLHNTTDVVMDELGDPRSSSPFQRRGLLLGDVQSGKTATYTAICNKAVDAHYKVIIVLSGITENLRAQTQRRLDSDFVGHETEFNLTPNDKSVSKTNRIGVGLIASNEDNPENNPICCFTSSKVDFKKSTLKALNLNLNNLQGAVLFVVKKNSSTLRNLSSWLASSNKNGVVDYPLLLIDDEADNASINTNGPDKNPTAINGLIRDILKTFKQASYIAVTATPFANIFIDPYIEDDDGAKDLFPRHFITMLPVPDHYIGPERIFGNGNIDDWDSLDSKRSEGEFSSALIPILNEEQINYFAYKHRKELCYTLNDLPQSLYEAINYFVLANAITDHRESANVHRSMLINVSRFTDVHNRTVILVKSYIGDLKSDIENYSQLDSDKYFKIDSFKKLYDIWTKFDLGKVSGLEWDVLVKKYLFNAIRRIEVTAVNQSTGPNALDYGAYKNGYRIIAVGGNSLSRGMTLEGLCVSYFYRNTMMYDTLLQMGRWFGYRDYYADLFKIWMGEDSIDSYGYITDAVNELKNEIIIMNNQKMTPEEFGLKVRNAPGSLIVTARIKMRSAKIIKQPITVSGRLLESPRLMCNMETVISNENLCKNFIKNITTSCTYDKFTKSYIWRNISKELVADLVESFVSHPWNLNFQSKFLADYIRTSEKFKVWDVAIPIGSESNSTEIILNNGDTISVSYEGKRLEKDDRVKDLLKVYGHHVRIGSGGCTKIGLDENKIKELRQHAKERKQPVNDATYLVEERNPILLIHIIENTNYSDSKVPEHIYALGLGFPKGEENRVAEYVVNTKELEQYIDYTDAMEEEDDDIDI